MFTTHHYLVAKSLQQCDDLTDFALITISAISTLWKACFVLTYAYDYFFQERARLEMERLAKHEEDLRLHAKKHDERRERKERERERREEERKQKELERIGNFF